MEKKRQDREMMEQLQKEAKAHQLIVFQEEYRKNSFEVAKARAKKDAASKSGLQKLRAVNRAQRLSEPSNMNSFFSKFSAYTQNNLAKKEENMKRTELMKSTAKQIRESNLEKNRKDRESRMVNRKVGWG